MKTPLFAIVSLLLVACATVRDDQEIEATRDFVVANELEQVDKIRLTGQLHYFLLNEYFVTVETRRGDYLLEFNTRCRALVRREFTPEMVDIRRDANNISARFDTIRGCMIGKIYEISEAQREELKALGDAPGEETFLLDEEDSGTDGDDAGSDTDS